MYQKSTNIHPSAPLDTTEVEHSLEKRLEDVYNFYNSIYITWKMITYFKDKNHKSKRKYEQ